jgi:tetratricopeptide (TPR) repeat protein
MICRFCKAEIPDYAYCPHCGQPTSSEADAARQPASLRVRNAFRRWVLPAAILVIVIAFGILGMALLGFFDGTQERDLANRQRAEVVYGRGEAYLECGQNQLAEAHFREALRLVPDYPGAADKLSVARARQTVTPSPTSPPPTSTPVIPTPTPEVVVVPVTDALFAEGEAHYERGEWEAAISTFEQLRLEDMSYKADQVAEMLFDSHYRLGMELDEQDKIEAAILQYDRALDLKPRDPSVSELRRRADLYQSALNEWSVDWDSVVNFLIALYHLAPDYKDGTDRLYEACVEYGDWLIKQERYCAASQLFEQAVEIRDDDESVLKREQDTAYLCQVTTPVPLETPTPNGHPSPWSEVHIGTLIGTCYNTHDDQYDICAQNAEDNALETWIPGAEQPAVSLDGRWLAYRAADPERAGLYVLDLLDGGTVITVTTESSAHYPTWSPDGTQLAYTQYDEEQADWFIHIATVGSTEPPRRVRQGAWPDWGPNGLLAFSTCGAENDCGIYTYDPTSDDLVQLTNAKQDRAPAWSPSGDELAYMSDIGLSLNLYVVQTETRHVRQITKNLFTDVMPVWSPDGQRIAFLTNHSDDWSVYSIHPWPGEGQAEQILTVGAESADWQRMQLAWSAKIISLPPAR